MNSAGRCALLVERAAADADQRDPQPGLGDEISLVDIDLGVGAHIAPHGGGVRIFHSALLVQGHFLVERKSHGMCRPTNGSTPNFIVNSIKPWSNRCLL
jgi:hypothetical protein